MKSLRRLVSLLLTLTMVLGLAGVRAEDEWINDPLWTASIGVVTATEVDGYIEVSIPIQFDGPESRYSFYCACEIFYSDNGVPGRWWDPSAGLNPHEPSGHFKTVLVWRVPYVPGRVVESYSLFVQSSSDDSWRTFDGQIIQCDHEGVGEFEFAYTEYYPYTDPDEAYRHFGCHKAVDVYQATCAKCGRLFDDYRNPRDERHTLPVCACGYVTPGHKAINYVTFLPVGDCCVGEEFRLVVETTDDVGYLKAVNDVNVPLNKNWERYETGDGTILWECVYTATAASEKRTWTVMAYTDTNKYLGSETSARLRIPTRDVMETENELQTRCQRALLEWDVLSRIARAGAFAFADEMGSEFKTSYLWQYFVRHSLNQAKGLTIWTTALEAFANPTKTFAAILSGGGDSLYTDDQLNEMMTELWELTILETLEDKQIEDYDGTSYSETLSERTTAWDFGWASVDLLRENAQDIAAIIEKLVKQGKLHKSAMDYVAKLKTAADTAKSASEFIEPINAIMGAFTTLIGAGAEGYEQATQTTEMINRYMALTEDKLKDLDAIIDNAREMGDMIRLEAALKAQERIQTDYIAWLEGFFDGMETAAESATYGILDWFIPIGIEIATYSGKTGLSSSISLPTIIAKFVQLVWDGDERYACAAKLYVLYTMADSIDPHAVADYDNCQLDFRMYKLLAQVHAAGCDAAIEYVNSFGYFFTNVEEKETLTNILLTEKQWFLDYAASLDESAGNFTPGGGEGGGGGGGGGR